MTTGGGSPHEDAILRSLRKIVRAIDLHSRKLESEFGLTGPQLVCLRVIEAHGPITPSDLARRVELSQGTVTGIVDRLVKRHLVSRRRSPADRRKVALALLPAGLELLQDAPSPLQTLFARRLARLPADNQAAIAAMLEQIVSMMDAQAIDAAPLLTPGTPDAPARTDPEPDPEQGTDPEPV